ncbi:hypothetical protein SSYM_0199, partial [Serratia symbiotica str. Tucson]
MGRLLIINIYPPSSRYPFSAILVLQDKTSGKVGFEFNSNGKNVNFLLVDKLLDFAFV